MKIIEQQIINLCNNYNNLINDKTINSIREFIIVNNDTSPNNILLSIIQNTGWQGLEHIILNWSLAKELNTFNNKNYYKTAISELFKYIIEKEDINVLREINGAYLLSDGNEDSLTSYINQLVKNEKCETCLMLKNQLNNWPEFFKNNNHNNFVLIDYSVEQSKILVDLVTLEIIPQWLKDQLLNNAAVYNNAKNMQYWLDQGADINLLSLGKIKKNIDILAHSQFARKGYYIHAAKQTRKIIVDNLPKELKNDNNAKWFKWTNNMLNSDNLNEVATFLYKEDILPLDSQKYNKYAECLMLLQEEEFRETIKNYKNKNYINTKFSHQLYKQAILSAKITNLQILVEEKIENKTYIKSAAFKNIANNGSLLKKKFKKEEIQA